MLGRAFDAGLRPAWVTADEVYGDDGTFRRFPEARGRPYVAAVRGDSLLFDGEARTAVAEAAARPPGRAWRPGGTGRGAKGPRVYDRAWRPFGPVDAGGWRRWLLVRRGRSDPSDRAYYLCRGPAGRPRRELVRAAGAGWAVEECVERAKGDCGLGQHEVRSWAGWYRHVTLSMLALAVLSAVRWRAASAAEKGGRWWS